jgi:DNA-3-methyladenine glycosylase II
VSPARPTAALAGAQGHLADADSVMAGLIARHGDCQLVRPSARRGARGAGDSRLAALVESVAYQQLAGRAAATIHARLVAALGGEVTAESILSVPEETLRGAGLSGFKTATIRGMAAATADGRLDLGAIDQRSDDDVVAELVQLRGVGPWTAQMFCIFTLGRLDVWPVSDFGVRKGFASAYGLAELPAPRWLQEAGEVLRPYRSVAAWYLWRAADAASESG